MMAAVAADENDRSVSSDQDMGQAVARQGVRGRVIAADGRPLRDVFVQATSLDRPAPAIPDIAITTDQAGNYFWALLPGRYSLTFFHQGRRLTSRDVGVRRNEVTPLDVRLPAQE
jgi:hypothetical protein